LGPSAGCASTQTPPPPPTSPEVSKQLQTDATALQTRNGAKPRTVADFFAERPSWLPGQLEVYRENPEKHIKPLCAAVAAVVLGDGARGDEVREEVERELARRGV
jgi:hypothetical protein